jgi:hypothetical protein
MDPSANPVEIAGDQPSPSLKERLKAGLRPRRHRPTKPQLVSRSQIDARTNAYKVFDKIVGDVTADLGGRDQLSAVETALVESFAGIFVMLDDLNVRVLLGEKVDPFVYCQVTSTLTRVASRLGLRRKPKDITPDLGSYLADRRHEPPDDDGDAP